MNPKRMVAALAMLVLTPLLLAAARPNVIVIVADDMGRNDVGFMGGKEIKTPHLDRLAASGVRLQQFYVQPVCSPTRAALLTGRYPMRYGLQVGVVRPWAKYGLPLEERLLPEALREVGYSTVMVGKWHLGSFDPAYHPTRRGFEHHYGNLQGALDYNTHLRDGALDWWRDGQPNKDEGYATHLMAKEAVRVIGEQPKDKPLFLYLAFNAVHAPHQAPASYKEPYANLKEPRRTYAGMLAAMDEGVGQVLDAVAAKGIGNDTLILFFSDNGGPRPGVVTDNGSLRAGKGTVYEGGVRVAACAAWPGKIKPGGVVDQPIHVVDVYPSVLKLAGVQSEQKLPVDGVDVCDVLAEGKPSPRTEVLINAAPNAGAIRVGDWKLVLNGNRRDAADGEEEPAAAAADAPKEATVELFNLKDDPGEKKDLAPEKAEKVRELRERYESYAKAAATPKNQRRRQQ
jgi:arylsulfatase A-like enzyme